MEESGNCNRTSFRRLVATVLASKWNWLAFLSIRIVHASRDRLCGSCNLSRDRATVLSIDGVGAFDHVLRAAMLSKMAEVPSFRELLPFVTAAYARPSSCVWVDEEGVRHPPLAAALQFGHDALEEIQQQSGPDVWNPKGVKILGTPVGHPEFLSIFVEQRLVEERKLWDAIPSVADLQCAWQFLFQCAGPRCHHLLRTVPPRQSFRHAQGHDEGMQRAMEVLLGSFLGDDAQVEMARHITILPLRMGGLGLRSALRMGVSFLGFVGGCIAHAAATLS